MTGMSPTPVRPERAERMMTFPEAIQKIIDGGKVTKKEWGNPAIYLLLDDGLLRIKKADGSIVPLFVSDGDMHGTDWYSVRVDERH
jgi:hypothetical protein